MLPTLLLSATTTLARFLLLVAYYRLVVAQIGESNDVSHHLDCCVKIIVVAGKKCYSRIHRGATCCRQFVNLSFQVK